MLFQKKDIPEIDTKIVNQLRGLSLDMINEAGSGHVGIALGAAPILYTLYSKHLKINPKDPNWVNRDKFIMSCGHGSSLLYSTLHLAGYQISIDDLKKFRQIDSITPGHPEYKITPGVDLSTGMLGNGFATSLGFALAESYLNAYFKSRGQNLIDYYTYVLVSDGDLMEGVASEAISLAGTLKLNKLIVLYDNNNISLDGEVTNTFTEDIQLKFTSNNWNVIEVGDGEDVISIDKAIAKAKESDKPTLISVKTTIGKYTNYEGTNKVHGNPLTDEEVLEVKNKLGVRDIPFAISSEVMESFQSQINSRIEKVYNDWQNLYESLEDKTEIDRIINKNLTINITSPDLEISADEELRVSLGKVLNMIKNPFFIGGSCDLASTCKTYLEDEGDFSSKNRLGKNIWFGVREHLSACVINGLCLSGIRAYTSTFLVFSDYMRPAIRMAAIMNIPSIFIFTHDSVTVGQDGVTHQPVEQLDSLRLIPNVEVYRPGDMNEIIGTFKTVLGKNEGVSIISISRNQVPLLNNTKISEVTKGAYILKEADRKLSGIIMASGEELPLALRLQERFLTNGIGFRVVSVPSLERFSHQEDEYINEILPPKIKIFSLEASTSTAYLKYVKEYDQLININSFGYSGKKEDVLGKLNYDIDSIHEKINNILAK